MQPRQLPLSEIETVIRYQFRNQALLEEAFTHSSCKRENPDFEGNDFQRLEFLGDAVLGFLLADLIFERYPEMREGEMTRMRSTLTQGKVLSEIGRQYQFPKYVRTGSTEQKHGIPKSAKITEDVVEALIGAIYKDGGMEAARKTLLFLLGDLNRWLEQQRYGDNPKGELQEWIQGKDPSAVLEYRLTNQEGPSHDRLFTVEVWINDRSMGSGVGKTRKDADRNAAAQALQKLKEGS